MAAQHLCPEAKWNHDSTAKSAAKPDGAVPATLPLGTPPLRSQVTCQDFSSTKQNLGFRNRTVAYKLSGTYLNL